MTIITKLEILAISILFSAIGLSVAYWDNVLLASVDLKGFWEYQDSVATHWYRYCLDKIWTNWGDYSCENMIKTFHWENGGRNKDLQSRCYATTTSRCANTWTPHQREQSFWFCQLNVRNDNWKSNIVFGKDFLLIL